MKNFLRNWLGINEDMGAVAQDITALHDQQVTINTNVYEMFHALPFVAGVLKLNAKDAALLTAPEGINGITMGSVLTGIIMSARQGNSSFEVPGEMPEAVRDGLKDRGFKVEDHEGTGGKSTFVLWT